MECPSENTIANFVDGTLPTDQRAALSDHLTRCDACRELVAALATDPVPAAADPSRPRARTEQSLHHGRYLLERVLGEGGMGVVYRAHDAQLRRAIALKVVRPDRLREESTGRVRERFLREAQAMAQLSHPHVVTVYDVGVDGDQVFVAMELVDGQTLRQWREQSHTLDEIGDVLDQAGQGLAAAHAAGLVHRDFKPDNVLVRFDGRVQVSDFGLARRYDSDELDPSGAPTSGPITGTLTATGVYAGTPAYMSPEQWIGERPSAASDQYSFCQVAWELIYGVRPHGETQDARDLKQRITSGTIMSPASSTVPAAVEQVLRRGLAREPSARFPDMPALLAALSAAIHHVAPARRRARPLVVATALASLVAIAVPVALWLRATPDRAPSSSEPQPQVTRHAEQAAASDRRGANDPAPVAIDPARGESAGVDSSAGAIETARVEAAGVDTSMGANDSAPIGSAGPIEPTKVGPAAVDRSSVDSRSLSIDTSRAPEPSRSSSKRSRKDRGKAERAATRSGSSSTDRAKVDRATPERSAPPGTTDRASTVDRSDAVLSDPWKLR